MNTATTIYGDVQPGDWVISAGNNDYSYLIGTVTAIDKLGTPEHGTENETDDVHVDFTAFDYPLERVAEIEEQFGDLYGEPKTFDELPLDDVIMAPKMLINISHLGHDEITRMGNLRHNCEGFCNCFPGGGSGPTSSREAVLIERIEKNYADYQKSLLGFGKQELIDMADRIAAMSDAYSYMTEWHGFDEDELDYFLEFQNPLEVLADELNERRTDLSDISSAMEHVYAESDSLLEQYPLIHDTPETPPVEYVGREAKQAYNMGESEFEKLMYGLFPNASPAAMVNWIKYANELEENDLRTKAEFFLELFVEFDLVKQHHGESVALLLFNHAESFTLNPFEVRGAANHILDGKHISEIDKLAIDGECDLAGQEWGESEQAIRAFISKDGNYAHLETADPPDAELQAQKKAPAKPPAKKSIGDRIAAGKAKAEAYKAQNPQPTTKTKKREID